MFSRAAPPHAPGVFALTLAVDGRAYPVVIGEGEDLAEALEAAAAALPPLPGAVGRLWMERAQARQRAHIVRDLVRKLNPPLNARAGRRGRRPRSPRSRPTARPRTSRRPGGRGRDGQRGGARPPRPGLLRRRAQGPADRPGHRRRGRRLGQSHRDRPRLLVEGAARHHPLQRLPVHRPRPLKLEPSHFDRWLEIFRATAAETLPPEAARRGDPQGRAHERVLPGGAHAGERAKAAARRTASVSRAAVSARSHPRRTVDNPASRQAAEVLAQSPEARQAGPSAVRATIGREPHVSRASTRRRVPIIPPIVMARSGETITYRQLDERSNRLAHLLRAAGLRRGDHYAVFMENHPRYIECCAAGERAGLYYTNVNSYLTAGRTRLYRQQLACRRC